MDYELKQELKLKNLQTDNHLLQLSLNEVMSLAADGLRDHPNAQCRDLFIAIQTRARVALEWGLVDGGISQGSGSHTRG